MQDSMITREVKSREWNVFHVLLITSVVFPGLNHSKVLLRKQDEILWIDIALASLFIDLACLVELWLQVGP